MFTDIPSLNYFLENSLHMTIYNKFKTDNPILDTILSTLAIGIFSLLCSQFSKMYNKIHDIDIGWLFTKNKIILEGKICTSTCNYSENIEKSILLYKIEINNKISSENNSKKDISEIDSYEKTIEDYKLLVMNPTLPRTRDYICKNIKCITHTNKVKKEAVFYKNPETYNVNYVCTVCYHPW